MATRNGKALFDEGSKAWPGIEVDPAAFARHLDRLPGDGELRAADLYLAFACASHHPKAIAYFEAELMPKAITAARSVDKAGVLGDEVASRLREVLLVSASGAPKIAQYSGKGPLVNWVRTAAMRTALNLLPRHPGEASDELGADLALATSDPEIDYLKRKYRADFKVAFEEAVEQLSDEDANLLRLHVIDKLSIDKLCAVYQIHRATAARRITKAREQLVEATRAHLMARLKLEPGELDSVINLVRSNLDLSLTRLLRRPAR